MEDAEIEVPETPSQELLINSKKYEMKLDQDSYLLLMEIYSNDKLCFKLRKSNNIQLYQYSNEYKYEDILNLLLLHKKHYEDLSKIFIFCDKAIINKKVKLIYNEKKKIMIMKLKRSLDFEEFECDIELKERKIKNEEIFKLLINEINAIKNKKENVQNSKYIEIIKDLTKKNNKNEQYIKTLEDKIKKLENKIDNLNNYIDERINQKLNSQNNKNMLNQQNILPQMNQQMNFQNMNNNMNLNNNINNNMNFNQMNSNLILNNNMNFNQMNNNNMKYNIMNMNPMINAKNDDKICILFRINDSSYPSINVICQPEEKISDMVKKYRNNCGNYEKNMRFLYRGEGLEYNKDKLISNVIIGNNANVLVVRI